jgi:hypothetical protein
VPRGVCASDNLSSFESSAAVVSQEVGIQNPVDGESSTAERRETRDERREKREERREEKEERREKREGEARARDR